MNYRYFNYENARTYNLKYGIKSSASACFGSDLLMLNPFTEVKFCTLFVFVSKVLLVILSIIIVVQRLPPRTEIMTVTRATVP